MTPATFDLSAAVRELERLGATPDAIAEHLAELGITGAVCDGERCPLANYLDTLGYHSAVVSDAVYLNGDITVGEELPLACAEFIEKFDFLDYPDLIRENA